jgi:hypothetical protein
MKATVVAGAAAAVAAGLVELALVIGATGWASVTSNDPGAGIAFAGLTILAFMLIVPFIAGIAGGAATREPHAVVGSVAGLYAASLVGLLLAGARLDTLAMIPVVVGLAALSLFTVMGHFLAIAIRPPAVTT